MGRAVVKHRLHRYPLCSFIAEERRRRLLRTKKGQNKFPAAPWWGTRGKAVLALSTRTQPFAHQWRRDVVRIESVANISIMAHVNFEARARQERGGHGRDKESGMVDRSSMYCIPPKGLRKQSSKQPTNQQIDQDRSPIYVRRCRSAPPPIPLCLRNKRHAKSSRAQ